MADRRADRLGYQVGPYRLTRLLGVGGFGEVYEADHQLLQQKRAIKLLLERHFHDPNQRERFLREARTLATLEHPNILPVLEVGEEGTILYLVMPFYQRGTLNDLLKQCTTPLPLAEIERVLAQMCAAVGYAHARHIAHLDLKPDNMLLHQDGRLVLSDFGLAHLIKQGRLEAGSSASWGTPYYMAPEQIRGEPGQRSDLYALGIILYQLLTNQRPFTGNAPEAVMMKHLLEAPPPLRTVSPAVPATLEPVIQKALGKQPEDRYATAEALLADFRAALSSLSPRPAQPFAPGVSPAATTPQMNGLAPAVQPTIIVSPERVLHAAEPATRTKTTAAVCEIELIDGRRCGIPPIGRCATCGRAFCLTHYAYANMCAPCFAETPAEVERAKKAKADREQSAALEYFYSGSARTALLTSGVQPVDISWIAEQKNKWGFFGDRWVDVITHGRGWILGEFLWTYPAVLKYDSGAFIDNLDASRAKKEVKVWLIALLDLYNDDLRNRKWEGLARVHRVSEGYQALGVSIRYERIASWEDLIKVARVVKRLVESSS